MVTWLGFKRTVKEGLISFAINTAITEVQIWTQPAFSMRKYKKYNSSLLQTASVEVYKPKAKCEFAASANGFSFRVVF